MKRYAIIAPTEFYPRFYRLMREKAKNESLARARSLAESDILHEAECLSESELRDRLGLVRIKDLLTEDRGPSLPFD